MNTLIHILGWSCVAYTMYQFYLLSCPAPVRVRAWDSRTGEPIEVEIV